ncbi:MAG TPA: ABC transporter substrate-binding protein [Candidatus Binatia bacterium]|nr:ABC transporter substrate-binding protein [Candidatus Binatia bacterium]
MFFRSLVLTLFAVSTLSLGSAQAQKLEKLVIGYPAPVASLGIIDVMRKAGLFRKNGLDVDLVYIQGSPILTTAMVSGQVPMAFLGGAALIAAAVGGADTVYLACGINTLYWRFFTTPDIKTIADLKGKKLGVTTIGSQEDSVVRFILRDRGLIADRDFAVVAVGGAPTRLAALSKGVIHGSTFIPPQDIAAERLGLNPLIDMSKLGLYNPGSCFASTRTYIKSHRDTVMRVIKTFVEGLHYYKENRDFVLKVTADFAQNRDPNVLNPTYDVVTRYQDRVPYVNMKGVEFMLKTLEARDPRAKTFDPNAVVDSSFIQELEKTGFIDSVWKK